MAIIFNGFISAISSGQVGRRLNVRTVSRSDGRGGSRPQRTTSSGFVSGDETPSRGVTLWPAKKCGARLALSGFGRVPRIEFHWEYLAVFDRRPGTAASSWSRRLRAKLFRARDFETPPRYSCSGETWTEREVRRLLGRRTDQQAKPRVTERLTAFTIDIRSLIYYTFIQNVEKICEDTFCYALERLHDTRFRALQLRCESSFAGFSAPGRPQLRAGTGRKGRIELAGAIGRA